jgi:hypothetical protein
MNDFHKIELKEIFARFQAIDNVRVQFAGFIGGLNLTALGFAFAYKNVSLLFIAALSAALYIVVDGAQRRNMAALCLRGFQLQEIYAKGEIYTSLYFFEPGIASQVLPLLKETEPSKLTRQLSLVPLKYLNFTGVWLPLLVIVLEITISVFLMQQGWHFA